MLKVAILVFIMVIAHNALVAQQDHTLFLMHNVPQSNFINPAVQINCQQYVGLPLLSSLHLNFNSTAFSYSTIANGSSNLDLNALVSKMHSWDFVSGEVHYTPVSFGFMYDNKQYFSFAWTERIETKIFASKKLLSMFIDATPSTWAMGLKPVTLVLMLCTTGSSRLVTQGWLTKI
ncbi:MAG TPA: DUF5723 family protein [Tenuifilaceae bacterium]|nr:DUF5723 family protein [Tenuifilaceae bacterium]